MKSESIQLWLKKKNRLTHCLLLCWVSFGSPVGWSVGAVRDLLACVCLHLYWGMGISAASELCFNRKFYVSPVWPLSLSGLFLVTLFIEWRRHSPWELGVYGKINSPLGTPALVFQGGGLAAIALLLANPHASATLISELLFTGPRLVLGAESLSREAFLSRNFEVAGCSRILEALLSRQAVVAYPELQANRSDADWAKLKLDLARIDGIVFLQTGLAMTDYLRDELHGLSK